MTLETNNESHLFTDLTLAEEELLSGGFLKKVGRWFKKNAGNVAIGVGFVALAVFGGSSGRQTTCAMINDGQDNEVCRRL